MKSLKAKDGSLTEAQCTGKLNAVADALYAIGGKWKLRIIIALADGHSRFNELQRVIRGISAKVLSNELKELEMNGFVVRKVHTSTPVVVEYQLTEYSGTLHNVLHALGEWGTQHRERIMKGIASPSPVVLRKKKTCKA